MRRPLLGIFPVLNLLVGCAPVRLTKAGGARTPRAPDCRFSMLTLPPDVGYLEVGTVDVPPRLVQAHPSLAR